MLEAPIVTKIKENKTAIISVALLLLAIIVVLIVAFSGDSKKPKKVSVPQAQVEQTLPEPQAPPQWQDKAEEDEKPAMESSVFSQPKTATATTTYQTYTILKGDSLIKIAKKIYGSSHYWTQIFDQNKDHIRDPDLIYPGHELVIPVFGEGKEVADKQAFVDAYIETYKSYRKQEKLETVYWLLLSGVKKNAPELLTYYFDEVKKFDRAFAQGYIDDDAQRSLVTKKNR